ncbi:MAG: vWA domain-containing protein [Flavobacteriaceae bacterium]
MFFQDTFANPEHLWALCVVPILAFWMFWRPRNKRSVLQISSLSGMEQPTFWARLYPVLHIFRLLAVMALIVALARPRTADISTRTKTTRGIDIVMAIDISSSMLSRDLRPNRLSALKKVAAEFVEDRINDRIGLVVYAGEAYTKTPITSDKAVVGNALTVLNYEGGVINDGTAIGMGLATAVNRLKDSKALSKVIILLTDGVNNAGFVDPTTAAGLAASYGIKTYTIGLGSNGNAMAPVAINRDGTFRYGLTRVEIDEELLRSVAEQTGGIYFRATDNQKLEAIYDEINKLETTEVEEFSYTTYDEHFRVFILLGLTFLFVEWILRITLYKSVV